MKRIVTIQDISCVGKCSLTVALPIISAMGVEACVLPTAVLSTHTAFTGFTFRDLTCDVQPIYNHWKKEKIHFDAIYSGYLGSFEQLNLMHQFIEEFQENDTLVIVDPCMADNGSLYHGFTKEFAAEMAKLCAKADVILPNLTEASFLLGIPYPEPGKYDRAYIENLLVKLAELGARRVVLKGVVFGESKMGIASYDSETKCFNWYFHKKMEQSFHGTGDIFASVLTGALMRGFSLKDAYSLAADFVVESIKNTLSEPDWNFYGVNFEQTIPYLIGRLKNKD